MLNMYHNNEAIVTNGFESVSDSFKSISITIKMNDNKKHALCMESLVNVARYLLMKELDVISWDIVESIEFQSRFEQTLFSMFEFSLDEWKYMVYSIAREYIQPKDIDHIKETIQEQVTEWTTSAHHFGRFKFHLLYLIHKIHNLILFSDDKEELLGKEELLETDEEDDVLDELSQLVNFARYLMLREYQLEHWNDVRLNLHDKLSREQLDKILYTMFGLSREEWKRIAIHFIHYDAPNLLPSPLEQYDTPILQDYIQTKLPMWEKLIRYHPQTKTLLQRILDKINLL